MHDDWRLRNQAAYLTGITLQQAKYVARSENWDHDHCMFCWAKFMEDDVPDHPEILHEGYATPDRYWWICPQCFDDFRAKFGWILID